MFMRYLGYGIGHKGQIKYAGPPIEVDNQAFSEEDALDLQNMERIARDATDLHKKARIAAAQAKKKQPLANAHQAAVDDARDGDDNAYDEDLDAVSNADADEEADLDGHL